MLREPLDERRAYFDARPVHHERDGHDVVGVTGQAVSAAGDRPGRVHEGLYKRPT